MLDEVPSGWSKRKLGDISTFQNGAAFKPKDWGQSGKPIVRIQNLNGGKDFNYFNGELDEKFKVRDGDLLFCWSGSRGTSFGPRYWYGEEGWLNQHIFNCHPISDVFKNYLYYLLDQLTSQIEQQAHGGAGLVHIKKSELTKFEYAVPPPKEQQRISKVLSSVDDSINATEAVIEQAERVKRGFMEELLTDGLGRQAVASGEVPDGWSREPLGKHVAIFSGIAPAKLSFDDGTTPYLKVADLNDSRIIQDSAKHWVAYEGKTLPAKSIIFPKRGAAIFTNKVRISSQECLLDTNLMGLTTGDGLDARFLYYYLVFEELHRIADTSSVPQINNKHINPLEVVLPSITRQQEIAGVLSSLDDQIEANLKCVERLLRLKRGLMDDLLTGRVRTVS